MSAWRDWYHQCLSSMRYMSSYSEVCMVGRLGAWFRAGCCGSLPGFRRETATGGEPPVTDYELRCSSVVQIQASQVLTHQAHQHQLDAGEKDRDSQNGWYSRRYVF